MEPSYKSGLFAGLTPNVLRLGWVSFLADVSSEMLYPVMPIFLTTLPDAPVAAVGLIEGVAESVASLPKTVSGRVSDRLGRKPVLVGGLLVFALVYVGLAAARHEWHLWVLFCVYGLYTAATDGVGKAFAVDLVPRAIRASAVGLLGTVTGVAALIASSVAGVLWSGLGAWHGLGVWGPFAYGALGALVASALISRLRVPTTAEPE